MKEYIPPVGQDKLKDFFKNIIDSNRLGHAYIFEGEKGIGKKTMAEYFSLLVMCEDHTPCFKCNKCMCTVSRSNPDIVYVDKGDKAIINVDKIRDVIKEIYIRPKLSKRRIFIIDEAHLMNDASQNALLKVIENPPEYAIFVLLTENKNMLLQTVRSRSMIIKIPPLKNEEIIKISDKKSQIGTLYAKGNPGKYLKLIDDEEFSYIREEFFREITKLFSKDEYGVYGILDFFLKYEERKESMFEFLISFFEDIMIKKNKINLALTNGDKISLFDKLCAGISNKTSVNLLSVVLDADREAAKYTSFSISMQAMLVRLWEEIHG